MQPNNRQDWSNGKYNEQIIKHFKTPSNLGLLQVVYSINTISAKSTGIIPYEVVFDQKPRCDIEMYQTRVLLMRKDSGMILLVHYKNVIIS